MHMSFGSRRFGGTLFAASRNDMAKLAADYQELLKELSTSNLKSVGNYSLETTLGEGSFGKVKLATHKLTGQKVAIKIIPKIHAENLTREIYHHRYLHHPHIVSLLEVISTETNIYIVMEYCEKGELFDFLLLQGGRLKENLARKIFYQICDFGFTRECESKRLLETICGSTGYSAPEMLSGKKYSGLEVDIWSLGVILYTLLCGSLPFDDDNELVMKEKIIKGEFVFEDFLSDEAKDLIRMMLSMEPTERPTARQILQHSCINSAPSAFQTRMNGLTHHRNNSLISKQSPSKPANLPPIPSSPISPSLSSPSLPPTPPISHNDSTSSTSISSTKTSTKISLSSKSSSRSPLPSITSLPPILSSPPSSPSSPSSSNHGNTTPTKITPSASTKITPLSLSASTSINTSSINTSSTNTSTPRTSNVQSLSLTLSTTKSWGPSQSTTSRASKRSSVDSKTLNEKIFFTTPEEIELLEKLDDLGFDVDSMKTSVLEGSCDSASGLWWLLLAKQREKKSTSSSPRQNIMVDVAVEEFTESSTEGNDYEYDYDNQPVPSPGDILPPTPPPRTYHTAPASRERRKSLILPSPEAVEPVLTPITAIASPPLSPKNYSTLPSAKSSRSVSPIPTANISMITNSFTNSNDDN
ncbi:16116_t:CDS:10, partial [Entrophospora sp. SA101]